MSETVVLNEYVQPAAQSPVQECRANSLAVVVLLLGASGIAVGVWSVWQLHHLKTNIEQQLGEVEALASQKLSITQIEQDNQRQLVMKLQADQQRTNQHLETVLGVSRKNWHLMEAEHLLRLASLRLSALQDISSAHALVKSADDIFREQNDPSSFAAREQLAKSLIALRSVEQPDRTGLFLQLGALRGQVAHLNTLAPQYNDVGDSPLGPAVDGDGANHWTQWWDEISHYIRIDFNADKNVRPLLAGQSLIQVRLALSLALEQAQWAVLNSQEPVYTQALVQAQEVLRNNFNSDNAKSQKILEQLVELSKQPVTVKTLELASTLSAVQAYFQRRNVNADEPGKAAAKPAQATSP